MRVSRLSGNKGKGMSEKEDSSLLQSEIKVLGALGRELWGPLQQSVKEIHSVNRSTLSDENLQLVTRAR